MDLPHVAVSPQREGKYLTVRGVSPLLTPASTRGSGVSYPVNSHNDLLGGSVILAPRRSSSEGARRRPLGLSYKGDYKIDDIEACAACIGKALLAKPSPHTELLV